MDPVTAVAMTLWGECRGEPFLGQVAVACVIRNRFTDSRWPDTYAGVVKQRKQFSCWDSIAPEPNPGLLWNRLLWIAKGIVEDLIPDITLGANHYINAYAAPPDPEWARTYNRVTLWPSILFGVHTFYRL